MFVICIAREIFCFKKLPVLGSSVHMLRFLQSLLKKNCAGAGRALIRSELKNNNENNARQRNSRKALFPIGKAQDE